ncbi:acetyl-CoA carboxylase biotin carboxyl carrier protein [[Limnothrix rosea] IAM M-220]|uniref:acetyl-CoA carboxylase biotin carboxyl carrier protein n=1 Tax=[Limnothrix rosea] IAM M-220 TaxID=454133 RepID=UPI00095E8B06|nr:acetyl-CoA carboxylase biotin carboxyl carrier protein [[Limnothrix rosea] IAM M-220]OKH18070.1 acetyl-CoA carboxylase, biotin carboxyl carrier protein [[Limnothrix rosea] IAM M-220]
MAINLQEIQELLSAIGQTNVTEFELKTDDFELRVSKGTVVAAPAVIPQDVNLAAPNIAPPPVVPTPAPAPTPETSGGSGIDDKWVAVTSPMVGTFYRAPAPGEDPFVSVGERVSSGDTVCIIEAMKLMNEIESEASGEVMKIAVEDGEPIEFGQTLLWINPA